MLSGAEASQVLYERFLRCRNDSSKTQLFCQSFKPYIVTVMLSGVEASHYFTCTDFSVIEMTV